MHLGSSDNPIAVNQIVDSFILDTSVHVRHPELDDLGVFTVDPMYQSTGFIEYKLRVKVDFPTVDYHVEAGLAYAGGVFSVDHEYNYFSDDYELLMGDLLDQIAAQGPSQGLSVHGGFKTLKNTVTQDLPDLHSIYVLEHYSNTMPWHPWPSLAQMYLPGISYNQQSQASFDASSYTDMNTLSRQYFIKWANDYVDLFDQADPTELDNGFKRSHTIVTQQTIREIFKYDDNRVENFPMHAKISFPNSPHNAQLAELIHGADIETKFFQWFVSKQRYSESNSHYLYNSFFGHIGSGAYSQYNHTLASKGVTGPARFITHASLGNLETSPNPSPIHLPFMQREINLTTQSGVRDSTGLPIMLLD